MLQFFFFLPTHFQIHHDLKFEGLIIAVGLHVMHLRHIIDQNPLYVPICP